nr:hypothetical protein APE1133 - Aeropyrum pernix (strain K1) [Aeropyrum pernix]
MEAPGDVGGRYPRLPGERVQEVAQRYVQGLAERPVPPGDKGDHGRVTPRNIEGHRVPEPRCEPRRLNVGHSMVHGDQGLPVLGRQRPRHGSPHPEGRPHTRPQSNGHSIHVSNGDPGLTQSLRHRLAGVEAEELSHLPGEYAPLPRSPPPPHIRPDDRGPGRDYPHAEGVGCRLYTQDEDLPIPLRRHKKTPDPGVEAPRPGAGACLLLLLGDELGVAALAAVPPLHRLHVVGHYAAAAGATPVLQLYDPLLVVDLVELVYVGL